MFVIVLFHENFTARALNFAIFGWTHKRLPKAAVCAHTHTHARTSLILLFISALPLLCCKTLLRSLCAGRWTPCLRNVVFNSAAPLLFLDTGCCACVSLCVCASDCCSPRLWMKATFFSFSSSITVIQCSSDYYQLSAFRRLLAPHKGVLTFV